MRALAGNRRARLGDPEAGFALIEVMVSAVLLIVLALATLKIIDGSAAASSTQRARSIASNLAHTDLNRMRLLSINSTGYAQTQTQTVSGIKFTVDSTAQWSSDSGGVVTCTSGSTGAQYLRVSSKVSWANMGAAKPVVAESLVTPRAGEMDATLGTLTVLIKDASGNPVPGAAVTAGTQSASTDATGCALIPRLPAGSYNVSYFKSGTIAPNRQSPGVEPSVSIAAGQTSLVQVSLDYPTRITADVKDDATGYPTRAWTSVSLVASGQSPVVTTSPSAATALVTANLYPWVGGYSTYAGDCTGNDPTAYVNDWTTTHPAASVASVPGGDTVNAVAYLHDLNLSVPVGGSSSAMPGGSALRVFVKPVTTVTAMSTCTSKAYLVQSAIPNGGSSYAFSVPVPYGVWSVCVDNGTSSTAAGTVTKKATAVQYNNYPATGGALKAGVPSPADLAKGPLTISTNNSGMAGCA